MTGIGLDLIAKLAAHLLQVPAAIVTVGAEQGIWRREGGRGWGVTAENFRHDNGQDLRFRAEVPITASGGWRIGAICVFDSRAPQGLAAGEQAVLADLAALAAMQYEGRWRAATPPALQRERRQAARTLAQIADNVALLIGRLGYVLRGKVKADRLRLLSNALNAVAGSVMVTRAAPLSLLGPRISLNQGFARMTGYGLDNVIGRTSQLLQGRHADPMAARRLGGRWAVNQNDVTARRDAKEDGLRHDAYFRALFARNPVAMFVYDIDTAEIVEVNQAALETYGYARAEFLARPLTALVQDEMGRSLAESLAAPGDGPGSGPAGRSWTYRRNDGAVRGARIATRTITFDGRRRCLVVLWEMTEIEELQATAAASQARMAELTEVSRRVGLGLWRFPLEGGVVNWSDEIFEIFGRSPAVTAVAEMLDWVHPEDRSIIEGAFRTVTATQSRQAFEFRPMRPDGQARYCRAELYPDLAPDGQCVALKGFCQDMTEQKEMELALLHSERLRTIGQLAAGVAHDFNNLLMVSVLNLDEAIDTLSPGSPLQEPLELALHATMQGKELTSQLLSYAHTVRPALTYVDLGAFFDRLLPLLGRAIGKRYVIEVQQGMGVKSLFCDVAKLENAVTNLVINARDAMPEGGAIVIETAEVMLTADSAGFDETVTPGPYTMIRVSDGGHGIPPDVLPRIFDPFFTTKPAGKGNGLGLSVMQRFVKQSGGYVTAESRLGIGTVMSIYLPASR